MEEEIKILENTGIIELKDGLSYDKAIDYKISVDKLLEELEIIQKDNEALEYQLKRLHTENSNITRELLARTDELNELLAEKKHKITCKLNVGVLENIQDFVPKQVIRNKIEFYKRYGKVQNSDEYVMSVEIFVLEEILGDE